MIPRFAAHADRKCPPPGVRLPDTHPTTTRKHPEAPSIRNACAKHYLGDLGPCGVDSKYTKPRLWRNLKPHRVPPLTRSRPTLTRTDGRMTAWTSPHPPHRPSTTPENRLFASLVRNGTLLAPLAPNSIWEHAGSIQRMLKPHLWLHLQPHRVPP